MSALDWASETASAFATEPPHRALSESVAAFASGARARVGSLRARLSPTATYDTTLCGERLSFIATEMIDVKRARTLNDELPAAEWLLADVDSDTVCWDVGAYHGHYTTLMAAKGATVLAFEPNEENLCRVRLNASLNDHRPTVYPIALSNDDDERVFGGPSHSELSIGGGDDGGSIYPADYADHVNRARRADTVTTRRGDGIQPAPDVLKIDVEGHEHAVLDGMRGHLDGVRRVLVEVHHGDGQTVRKRLADAGLSTRDIDTPRSQTYIGGER